MHERALLVTQALISNQRHILALLRQARDQVGFSYHQVAEKLNWPLAKLVAIETGAARAPINDLKQLLNLYNASRSEDSEKILALAEANNNGAWWNNEFGLHGQYPFNPALQAMLELENSTTCFRQYLPQYIPGLLQTKQYAQAIIELYDDEATPQQRQIGVKVRMRRQELLQRGLETYIIIDEAALYREVGSPEIQRSQLLHLKNLNKQANIGIQVLPCKARLHPGMLTGFTIYELFTPENNELEFAVTLHNNPQGKEQTHTNPQRVAYYLQTFLELASLAIPSDHLDDIIDPILDGLPV